LVGITTIGAVVSFQVTIESYGGELGIDVMNISTDITESFSSELVVFVGQVFMIEIT
jgi:hypothetical protein